MDLHIHTPGSKDYQQPEISYLDVLQQAERRGLNIMAFTDHNTVRGYREMQEEIEQLEWLAESERINPEERYRLEEYRRLFDKMLILPGFEFTAAFGFHILGIFSPDTNVRYLEHLLLDLEIAPEVLDQGETNVGATEDVLTAYAAIREAGGIAIAAHANSSHGVAMRGISFGGQTRIAYTQDLNLFALEVTDLDRRGRRTTMRFFDGSKPEYPRPMRCIQGSDAHRLERDPRNPKNLGVGERVTEVLLPELSFEALYDVFAGNDFALTRPYRGSHTPYDHVLAARQEGPSIVQAFHESMSVRGGRLYAIIADVCAFSNTNGGTLYVGASSNPKVKPVGVESISKSVEQLKNEIHRRITPPVSVDIDVMSTEGERVIRVQVPLGEDPPYAIDDNKIYVREETETSLAVRDEIVQLVRRGESMLGGPKRAEVPQEKEPAEPQPSRPSPKPRHEHEPSDKIEAPRTGVEIVATEKRNDTYYHHLRDLRNGNIVRNVTRKSARKLWHYAITQVEDGKVKLDRLAWQEGIAEIQSYKRAGKMRYDLAQRENGKTRMYFGVTEDGIQDGQHKAWRELLSLEEED
jgi:hypothetical protein